MNAISDTRLGPISADVHHARVEDDSASLKLLSNQIKWLKVAAQKYENDGVPLDKLNNFINVMYSIPITR